MEIAPDDEYLLGEDDETILAIKAAAFDSVVAVLDPLNALEMPAIDDDGERRAFRSDAFADVCALLDPDDPERPWPELVDVITRAREELGGRKAELGRNDGLALWMAVNDVALIARGDLRDYLEERHEQATLIDLAE